MENTMKLSDTTLKILKNFSEINNSIFIRKHSSLVTVDPQLRIVADAELDVPFEKDFAIYNLGEFLAVNSAQQNSSLIFEDDKVVFSNEASSSTLDYFYSDPTNVQDAMPTRNKIPTVFHEDSIVHRFTVTESDLKSIRLSASLLSLTHISFIGSQDSIKIVVRDLASKSTQNKYTVTLSSKTRGEFDQTFNMLFENLKIISDTYDVELSPSVAHFIGKNTGVQYWVVMEA
jgi:hypothetical protein